jgi:hypothetical protein
LHFLCRRLGHSDALPPQEGSQILATRMVEHVGSASSILMRLLDAAATQPSLVPPLVQLMQVGALCVTAMTIVILLV